MIFVDSALKKRSESGHPLRVGVVGCGFLGSALIKQIIERVDGMEISCIATRTPEKAVELLRSLKSGPRDYAEPSNLVELNQSILDGKLVVTSDPMFMCKAEGIEVILDASGSIETGAKIALECIDSRKHLVLINAELDATIGPLLHYKASQKGLVFTGTDGDQPGSQINLFRFVRASGLTPLVCGNIKGLQDHYRTPKTQESFAKEWGQNPTMVTSFADGTKISFEQALVANATGFRVSQRGMIGMQFQGHVDELTEKYDISMLEASGGIVDYVVGPKPGPGVYVVAKEIDPDRQHYLKYFKMGNGPLYSFYTPYHLCHLEAPITAARAALLGDPAIKPIAGPVVDVIAVAKRNLQKGDRLDGIGGFTAYGVCENSTKVREENLLPIGLSHGCLIEQDVSIDSPISWADVSIPNNSLIKKLWDEQNDLFFAEK